MEQLLGTWETEATHPAMPGVVVKGTATIEWLDGERFLAIRARTDHDKFPDSTSILGVMDHGVAPDGTVPRGGELRMHYYDSRGVFRDYATSVDDTAWRWSRADGEFPQRFTGRFADGGDTIIGSSEVAEDGATWKADLAITYRRRR